MDDEGTLDPSGEKVRGRKNALDALVNHMAKTVEHPEEQVIFISHGNAPKDAEYVAEQVKSRFAVQNIYINYIGPGHHLDRTPVWDGRSIFPGKQQKLSASKEGNESNE